MRLDTIDPLWVTVTDDQRSVRNWKLSDEELENIRKTLRDSPQVAGYDKPAWTTMLVRHRLEEGN